MENLPQGLTAHPKAHPWQRVGWLAAFALGLGTLGCETLGHFASRTDDVPKPSPSCCQAVVTWSNKVHSAPDVMNNGAPMPGLAGRLYLFGPTIDYPLVGDGSVTIDLFDDAAPQPQTQPLERWHIDADTLKRLVKKDAIGWGYTLFLPWSSCKREITRVHLTVRFDQKTGTPLYTPSGPLTLEHPGAAPDAQSSHPPVGPPATPVPPVLQSKR